ncbi:hypothetical protein HPB50_024806 [Hyalomma asiaticum]|uniref:Uncharacterized protein n=1 Tax=Hyalomma asiaticum TaxID=266040 RepID=A0ACB7TBS9_HYAAI|nr:hypothetical protein HPB50_024806 [Hyalomma asiaticum]
MACSAVTLSISTITAVLALACLSISFGTDNWLETRVNRTAIRQTLQKDTDEYRAYETRMEYFSRDTGLFRICFPEKKPKGHDDWPTVGGIQTTLPLFTLSAYALPARYCRPLQPSHFAVVCSYLCVIVVCYN